MRGAGGPRWAESRVPPPAEPPALSRLRIKVRNSQRRLKNGLSFGESGVRPKARAGGAGPGPMPTPNLQEAWGSAGAAGEAPAGGFLGANLGQPLLGAPGQLSPAADPALVLPDSPFFQTATDKAPSWGKKEGRREKRYFPRFKRSKRLPVKPSPPPRLCTIKNAFNNINKYRQRGELAQDQSHAVQKSDHVSVWLDTISL